MKSLFLKLDENEELVNLGVHNIDKILNEDDSIIFNNIYYTITNYIFSVDCNITIYFITTDVLDESDKKDMNLILNELRKIKIDTL